MTDQPANPNVFALISTYRCMPSQECISKAGIAKLASAIDSIYLSTMLPAELPIDLDEGDYYSIAMLFDGIYMALIVDVSMVVVESVSGQIKDTFKFDNGVLGVGSFRDLLIVFYKSKRIDFYRMATTGSTELLWKTLDVCPIERLPDWFVFSEKYRISTSGILYLIDNDFKLWMADLNKLGKLKDSGSCPFFEVNQNVIDLTLGWNKMDICYLTEEGNMIINKKKVCRLDLEGDASTKAQNTILSVARNHILVSLRLDTDKHKFELRSLKGTLQSTFVNNFTGDSTGDLLKNITSFEHKRISMFVMTAYYTHAYIFAIRRDRLHMVKQPFKSGINQTNESITNNCTIVMEGSKYVDIVFCGYDRQLSKLRLNNKLAKNL